MNKTIKNTNDLKSAIAELEKKRIVQEEVLTNELQVAYENLKPLNVLQKITSSPGVRNNLLKAAIGLGAGVLSKNLLIGKSAGILKNVIGNVIKFGVAALVTKNSGKIKEKGTGRLKMLLWKTKKILTKLLNRIKISLIKVPALQPPVNPNHKQIHRKAEIRILLMNRIR